ncbi:MAG: hypothetical protein H7240_07890 [Glaciimonas sp.]|nr:hypothetical protein [Glaciimonas sp.]
MSRSTNKAMSKATNNTMHETVQEVQAARRATAIGAGMCAAFPFFLGKQ